MNHKIISTTKIGYLQDNFGSKCLAGYTGCILGTQAVNRKAILDSATVIEKIVYKTLISLNRFNTLYFYFLHYI